jgi:hypothetical protein
MIPGAAISRVTEFDVGKMGSPAPAPRHALIRG